MIIRVRAEHIVLGECAHHKRCMIAAAIKEADPTVSYVSVRTNGITVTRRRRNGAGVRQHWAVPLKAARAIIAFDRGEAVQPFIFEPKFIDQMVIPPVPLEQRVKSARKTRRTRAKRRAAGLPSQQYKQPVRIAGV